MSKLKSLPVIDLRQLTEDTIVYVVLNGSDYQMTLGTLLKFTLTQDRIYTAVKAILRQGEGTDLTPNDKQHIITIGSPGITPTPTVNHTRYVGWSLDKPIETVDFASAGTSEDNTIVLPATDANAYIWFAIPEPVGYPLKLFIGNGRRNQIDVFTRQAGTVDDSNGNPHIVGVQDRLSPSALAGQNIRLEF